MSKPIILVGFDEATGYLHVYRDGVQYLWAFDEYPDHPHECKDLADAEEYCRKLGDQYQVTAFNSNVIEE